jgi:predicted ATPase/serine phosphatase RsbU (regulator of sigma subunit)/tRNA A-37 threonylcarbamoyl transferase component Bud32
MKAGVADHLPGDFGMFKPTEILQSGTKTNVYKGISKIDSKNVVIKVPSNFLDEKASERLLIESELLKSLEGTQVPKVLQSGDQVLVMEFIEGISLLDYISQIKFITLDKFFRIAISILETLDFIHKKGVIHRDLNPTNILINPLDFQLTVIDFGLATRHEIQSAPNLPPKFMEGVLSYISPEQTGRMNRGVDNRSDIYALGVIFYQMLSHRLPFDKSDPLELIHCHLAVTPKSLQTERKDIPRDLDALILKMLSKNPEERYQSASGIIFDLKAISQNVKSGRFDTIELGKNDKTLKFAISSKLYGRDQEKTTLLDSYKECSQGAKKMLLLAAPSGQGKTSLISEIHRPIAANKGLFLSGKFDALQRNVSYLAWRQVFESLSSWLFSRTDLDVWVEKIKKAVGVNGKILLEIYPALEQIIGEQPPVAEQDALNQQNRFFYTIKSFLSLFCTSSSPVVISIDDWQWADQASIVLLKELFEDKSLSHVLFLCAYRDNEVNANHIFDIILSEIDPQYQENIQKLTLKPLAHKDIEELLADTFNVCDIDLHHFSMVLLNKTLGNAFFVHQIIKSLYNDKIIYLDENKWKIDQQKLDKLNITTNVVEFMLDKLINLNDTSKTVLLAASCIGSNFESSLLQAVLDWDKAKLRAALAEPLNQGMILAQGNDMVSFKFAHDSIQKACFSLRNDQERLDIEYKLAQSREKILNFSPSQLLLFATTQSYNHAKSLLKNKEERIKVAELNLKSAQSAQNSADFNSAMEFTLQGMSLLDQNSWKDNYQLIRDLHKEALESAYRIGGNPMVEKWLQDLLDYAENDLDRALALEIKVEYHKSNQDYVSAFEVGMKVLELLDIKLGKPNLFTIITSIFGAKAKLDFIGFNKLTNYRKTDDIKALAQERALLNLGIVVYFSKPEYLPILAPAQVQVVLKNGFSIYTPYTIMSFALNMIAGLGNITYGYKLGKLAKQIKSQFPDTKLEGRIGFLHRHFVRHWVEPQRDVALSSIDLYYKCIELGDFEFAVYAAISATKMMYTSGQPISKIKQWATIWQKEFKEKLKSKSRYEEYLAVHSFIAWFSGDVNQLQMWNGEAFSVKELVKLFEKSQNKTALAAIYWGRMVGSVVIEDFESAKNDIFFFEKYVGSNTATADYNNYLFYKSIALFNQIKKSKTKDSQAIKFISKSIAKYKKWSKIAPYNFESKYYFLLAEMAMLKNQYRKAIDFFNKSQQTSSKFGNLIEMGLAHEKNADLHIQLNETALAKFHIQEAYESYNLWQSPTKIKLFESKYASYLKKRDQIISSSQESSEERLKKYNIDVITLIKSSTAISSEIVLDVLLEKVLDIVLANAGAQRGVLLTYNDDNLVVEGEIDTRNGLKRFREKSLSQNLSSSLPYTLLYYSARSVKLTVLQDPHQSAQYSQDDYFKSNPVRNLMVLPLTKQAKVLAVLYLEHFDSPDIFSTERIDIIKLLAAQMAVSLENAMLYEGLEEKVKQRTQEVSFQKQTIEEQKNLLQKVNNNLIASLNFAKEIQRAILLPVEDIEKLFRRCFVFFKPKDIVSGDFYWIRSQADKIWIAVVDCTGHGVPGALVSMIANSILDEILIKKDVISPEKMLNELRLSLQTVFKMQQSSVRVGMDIALVLVDHDRKQLSFSGAKSPLAYFQNNQLHILKSDSFSIESVVRKSDKDFNLMQIDISIPTSLYLFTDGFQDQFGGKEKRKFSAKRFNQLLVKADSIPMENQKDFFEQTLIDWMNEGNENQIDDILVMGIKL